MYIIYTLTRLKHYNMEYYMNDQAQVLLNQLKSEVTKEKKPAIIVQLTHEQKALLESLAVTNETSVANLVRIALKVTFDIK